MKKVLSRVCRVSAFCIPLLSMVAFCGLGGCGSSGPSQADSSGTHEHSHDGHSHNGHSHGDHSHSDEATTSGDKTNGGHNFTFEPPDFAGEWAHTFNSDLIRVFVLDKDTKSKKSVKVDSISIRRGDTIFSLDPEDADDQGMTATYSLDDKQLAIAMNLGVTLEMTIGDKTYTAKIAPHSHKH